MKITKTNRALAEKTAEIQRWRPFGPGLSGNPKGSRNKTTLAIEGLLDGESEAITRKRVEKAREGDTTSLRLCLDRLVPPRRDRTVEFDLPRIETAADGCVPRPTRGRSCQCTSAPNPC